ncbi:sensor histidine kinase [Nocardia higoensis]|uniref:sensor histidine kinase n=1 Tax=Nocardia higoensis TaxID=228599 RepID=UPI0012F65E8F|nr:ATP-binding protein [Nocardia higoensis]
MGRGARRRAAETDATKTTGQVVRKGARTGFRLRHGVFVMVAVAYWTAPDSPPAGLAVVTAFGMWSLWRLIFQRSRSAMWSVLDLAVAALFLLATPVTTVDFSFTTEANPLLAVSGTAIISYAIAWPWRWSAGASAVAVAAWAMGAGAAGVANPFALFALDFLVVEWALASVLRWSVVRSAGLVDAALAAVSAVRIDGQVAEARRRSERQQWAAMHDTAASTLLMVGQGVVTDADTLRKQTRRDIDVIGALTRERDDRVLDVAAEIRETAREMTTACRVEGSSALEVGGELGQALVAAVREALTNVDRHAGASEVIVRIGEGSIRIVDDGKGFDPDGQRVRRRHGVRNSIKRRLDDVGAVGWIVTAPGQGTRVELRWDTGAEQPAAASGSDEADRAREPADSVAGIKQLTRGYGYGLLAVAVVVVASQAPRALLDTTARPGAQAAVIAVVVGVCAVAAAGIRWGIPAWVRRTATVAAVASVPVQGLLSTPEVIDTGAFWAMGAVGWPVAALTFRLPLRVSLLWLAAVWAGGAIVLLWQVPERATVAELGYNLAGVAGVQAVALIFTVSLRRGMRTAERSHAEHTGIRAAEEIRRALQADFRSRYERLAGTVVPLLTRLHDDPHRAGSTEVRAACLIESARLRRLFAQVDMQDHPLVAQLTPAVDAAEKRGVNVAVDIEPNLPELPEHLGPVLLNAPVQVLAAARGKARVVVSTDDAGLSISVLGDCDPIAGLASADLGGGVTQTVTLLGDTLWLEVHGPAGRRADAPSTGL